MTCREQILSNEFYDFLYNYDITGFAERDFFRNISVNDAGADTDVGNRYCVQDAGFQFGCVHVPREDFGELENRRLPYFGIPKLFGLMDVSAVEAIGATTMQHYGNLNLTGEGCLIGFIDTGISYTLDCFRNASGGTRIDAIWDQTIQTGTVPDGFAYGSLYTRSDIDAALDAEDPYSIVPHRDEISHGTYLASVAAGSRDILNDFTGVVPEADLVVVKLKETKQYLRQFYLVPESAHAYQENDIMIGLRFLHDYAVRERKPMVVVIGLGSSSGDHTGSGALSLLINEYCRGVGFTVCLAAGNEGDKRHHFFGTVGQSDEYKDIEIRVGEANRANQGDVPQGFIAEIWGLPPDIFSYTFISPEGETVPRITTGVGDSDRITFLLNNTVIEVQYRLLEFVSGDVLIFMRFVNPTPGIWTIRLYGRNILEGSFHMWLPIEEFLFAEVYCLYPDPNTTLVEPANNMRGITVSGYNHRTGSFFIESSRGFTRRQDRKPDFAAPAVSVYGIDNRGNYVNRSGTSISAALVAGVCVQLYQWGIVQESLPYMTPVVQRNFLIRGADRSGQTELVTRTFGYGKVNIYNSFLALFFQR